MTTGRTHLIAGPRVYEILGNVDNEVRKEMESIAIKSGLKFIVNVVLDASGTVAGVVAGDVVKAHRAGIEIARPIYTIELAERPDIVVASSHPADRDLWQGFKPVNNCGMMARDGGTLILIIPAPEGIAPDHTLLVDFGTTPGDKVLALVNSGKMHDEVAAATYLAFDQTRKRIHHRTRLGWNSRQRSTQDRDHVQQPISTRRWRKLSSAMAAMRASESSRRAQTSWRTFTGKESEQYAAVCSESHHDV